MNDLLRALHLIWKYLKDPNTKWPTSCEHDILYVCNVNMSIISLEDLHKLAKLGFIPGDGDCDVSFTSIYDEEGDYCGDVDFENISQEDWDNIKNDITDCFHSYRFGSC